MDTWISNHNDQGGLVSEITSSFLQGGGNILNLTDPLLAKINVVKKSLQAAIELDEYTGGTSKNLVELLVSSCDGDLVTLENALRHNPDLVNQLFPNEENGISCLVFAICFDHPSLVELILRNSKADPDLNDTIVYYTPLMWAIHFNQIETVKLLLNYDADPYLCPKDDGKSAISLVGPDKFEIYEYFKIHNLLKQGSIEPEDDFYQMSFEQRDPLMDDLSNKIKLQSITSNHYQEEEKVAAYDEEAELANDPILSTLEDFQYDQLLPDQYIKFSDSDIPKLLDYIFEIRTKKIQYQYETKLPAAIIFQLVRYSHSKVESIELTEYLFEFFTTRLRSVTNTTSGVFNMATTDNTSPMGGSGDIVLLSYWLSVIQFLHFYFTKGNIYKKYPNFLQELVNLEQSLIATLSFSVNSRLNLLVDDCLLNFTNLIDVTNVLYAKDWNLFKSKPKEKLATYEDIMDMLYPPSMDQLMKPSPIKYLQVLGALDYVLRIHEVDNLIKSQTISQVFYYIDATIFNRIISQSKYCSRAKAIQIRLNISNLEDWLRRHNYSIYKPNSIGGLNSLCGNINKPLNNLLSDSSELDSPHSLAFYYHSLYHIGKKHLQPTIELLQWLQCVSLLEDEESLVLTINQFESLNYYQLFKVMNKLYKYEVNEQKIPKKLINKVKSYVNELGEKQIDSLSLHYMTQTNFLSKETYIYLNPNYVFGVTLPNLEELINNFGSGLGGIRVFRSRKYQPSLPIPVADDIEEMITENHRNINDTYDYEEQQESIESEEENTNRTENPIDIFKGDNLFKEVRLPSSLAHKNWGDDELETNQW